jgi:hypothetical protein
MGKSVVFGVLIALIGCHWGLRVKPNTQSLGEGTTASVVTSITMVIIVDAIFAILPQRGDLMTTAVAPPSAAAAAPSAWCASQAVERLW